MTIFRILFILMLLTTGGWCQSPGFVDSLKQELNREGISDTAKTVILLKMTYFVRNEPSDALRYGEKALFLAQKLKLKKIEACAYAYIGDAERSLGNRIAAIDALINSANLYHKLGDKAREAPNLSAIAGIFSIDKDLANSIKYNRQALSTFIEIQDSFFIASVQVNIGETFRMLDMLDSAAYFFNLAFANFNLIENGDFPRIEQGKNTTIGNLGMIHLKQGKLNQAREELNKALSFFQKLNDPYRMSVYQSEMGKLLILEGNVEEGERLIDESLEMAKEAQLKDQIREFNLQLSTFYEERNQYQQAFYHFKQYKCYDDSLKNVENVRNLEKLQSQFQLSKKEEEISILNRVNRLQRGLGYAIMGGVSILIIFFFILFQSNRKIKLQNKKIKEQSLIVKQREQEKALLLKELNHRVKNNLQMVASLLNLQARQLKDHPAAEALMEGKYRVEALTLIHQKLYRDDVDTKINIKDYIEELVSNLVLNFGEEFQLVLNLEPFVMKIDKAIPLGLIINELVTNSLKYGHENNNSPLLQIHVKKEYEKLIIIIEDNGVGLPSNFDFKLTESFGLKLVHSLVKQLGGVIEWNSNKGTQWKLALDTSKIS